VMCAAFPWPRTAPHDDTRRSTARRARMTVIMATAWRCSRIGSGSRYCSASRRRPSIAFPHAVAESRERIAHGPHLSRPVPDLEGDGCQGRSRRDTTPAGSSNSGSDEKTSSLLRQVLVDEHDGHRPLSHGRGDALHRSMTDIASGEDTWVARFERERLSCARTVG